MSDIKCRRIVERVIVTGQLRLETPAHFGNGDADTLTDMPLLLDEVDRSPLLTGASLAGALRNYLRERELGYWVSPPQPPTNPNDNPAQTTYEAELKQARKLAATNLFGGQRGDDEGTRQSPLIIHDALGTAADIERRDGVRIDPKTRTAEDDKKFDFELLAAGSTFELRFELLIGLPERAERESAEFHGHRNKLLQALATALDGLARGEIMLGARKRRGFGHCSVSSWNVQRYDLCDRAGLRAWLAEGRTTAGAPWDDSCESTVTPNIAEALAVTLLPDQRRKVHLRAEFSLDGSLLVRSGAPDSGPDIVHLHSPRAGGPPVPILAGTSWAGVLRSRATQIAHTLAPAVERRKMAQWLDGIFGPAEIKQRRHRTSRNEGVKASRLEVAESEISDALVLEQTRVKIDRFTGGAAEAALFSERPLFGASTTRLQLDLSLRLPLTNRNATVQRREQAEIGLLLLLLKDLWTGDLPLGGESGSGRGRLRGLKADCVAPEHVWTITHNDDGRLEITGEREALQACVAALKEELDYA
jgi:CRISPR/Cas system CSM-associated protein Csm3 (group 7 of RAMP superfamily)